MDTLTKFSETILSDVITLVFGIRATGEKLSEPRKFPIRNVTETECNQWANEFKVGSRYGHRGSFYQTR
jgi:hypothetical protein